MQMSSIGSLGQNLDLTSTSLQLMEKEYRLSSACGPGSTHHSLNTNQRRLSDLSPGKHLCRIKTCALLGAIFQSNIYFLLQA